MFIQIFKSDIDKTQSTFFETTTALACWYFKKENVDIAIMETGLGGRFDSVTACNANIFGITSISIDHSHILGDNLIMIAKEKIAAIQEKSTVYSVKHESSIESLITKKCVKKNCYYHFERNGLLSFLKKLGITWPSYI